MLSNPYDINDLDLSEAFSDDTDDLFKDHLDIHTVDSIDGRMKNNCVLVEVERFMYNKIKTSNGIELFVDNTHTISNYAVRSGVLTKLPERLIFWHENKLSGMPWETEIEAKVGDRVWFYGMSAHSGEKIMCNGKKYIIMRYEDLYVAKRGDDVICLNGNVVLDVLTVMQKALSYEKVYVDPNFAKVAYIGSCNKKYEASYTDDDPDIKKGMTVCITGLVARRLEIEPYLDFDGNEHIICQNNEISGYLE